MGEEEEEEKISFVRILLFDKIQLEPERGLLERGVGGVVVFENQYFS
jgi:hypothetical protein